MKFGTSLKHCREPKMENTFHFGRTCVSLVKLIGISWWDIREGRLHQEDDYLMKSHVGHGILGGPLPSFFLHCFAFWERQLRYYEQESLKSTPLSRLRRWRALKASAASTHGTSPVVCLISSSFECRNEMFFLGDFSRWMLLTYKVMSDRLQIDFSSGLNDFVHSWPDCAMLNSEVRRMKGVCVYA